MTNQPETHLGRSFRGMSPDIETACPCPKAACGLVIREQVTKKCREHHVSAAKTIRQTHTADQCPGAPQPEDPAAVALAPLEAAVRAERRAQQTGDRTALRDRIADALRKESSRVDDIALANAVLAVLSEPTDQAAVRAAALQEAADRLWALADRTTERGAGVLWVADWLRRLADEQPTTPTTEPTGPHCVCGHPTRLHHEDVCLRADCGCADSLEINALPEALKAVLTKRYTELGNPFSEMRRREQGPDGWPASHPIGPHHVAETLRELLTRTANDEPAGSAAPAKEA
ncbi:MULTISPECIES: hypothetical protein [unclassified Streptomyces]|uniref:hypothetical protein n=1 Tax=unclassified Streptomyces TaxID=2593676 RepID=UPI001F367A25|nr:MULTISPECIES: hypothetical protein [unclassified Streptomyces]MCF0086656.1 hypothetical protein [Streptomyces sp. MH192]MCF0098810.1 hypothetical protein [Streptomyces sp. MH191]